LWKRLDKFHERVQLEDGKHLDGTEKWSLWKVEVSSDGNTVATTQPKGLQEFEIIHNAFNGFLREFLTIG